jgi:hypothetical protein
MAVQFPTAWPAAIAESEGIEEVLSSDGPKESVVRAIVGPTAPQRFTAERPVKTAYTDGETLLCTPVNSSKTRGVRGIAYKV